MGIMATQHNILMLVHSAVTTRRRRKSPSRCEGWNDEDCESLQGRMMCDSLSVTISLTKGHHGKKRETAGGRCEPAPSLASALRAGLQLPQGRRGLRVAE
jgi:hypothetical protein